MNASPNRERPGGLLVIARSRARQLVNAVDQQLREAPWQTLAVLVLLGLIWAALYFLLEHVLGQVRGWGLVGFIADKHLYVHFFVALAIMLAFSNAVLMFGSLYGRHEAAHLLSMPVHARHVVTIKWIEGIFLSSWAFMLLGVPLMLAASSNVSVDWYYYPLFLGHFLGFVVIPACVGLLAAWAVAMWAPKRPIMIAIGGASILLLLVIYWFMRLSREATESEQLLRLIFGQVGMIKQPYLPWTWTASGIVHAANHEAAKSLFYLMVVLGNAAFLSWLTVNILAKTWPDAYSRAQLGRHFATIRSGWLTAAACAVFFFYLPPAARRVMLKDLRSFCRDPRQWSQMLIMIGLLFIYVLNLTRLPLDYRNMQMKSLVAFLNLTTISLILATFTSRFIYPLLSLESQQLWLIETLPVSRSTLLLVKFLFACLVTTFAGGAVMTLACYVLQLPPLWTQVNLAVSVAVCIGLSGLSIGLGARFPVIGQRNPARIAASVGGTFNLVTSMLFVFIEMAGVAYIGVKSLGSNLDPSLGPLEQLHPDAWRMLIGLLVLGLAAAAGALVVGVHHFKRLEV